MIKPISYTREINYRVLLGEGETNTKEDIKSSMCRLPTHSCIHGKKGGKLLHTKDKDLLFLIGIIL